MVLLCGILCLFSFTGDLESSAGEVVKKDEAVITIRYHAQISLEAILKANEANLKRVSPASGPLPPTYTDLLTGIEFVFIKGGCFQMGDLFNEGGEDELPVHRACVDDFYMGKYEVTQKQWKTIWDENLSQFKGNNLPANASWDDAQIFLTALSVLSGKNYRLPTEAEWEYAARERGRKVRFGNGKDILRPSEANFLATMRFQQVYSRLGSYRKQTAPVGSYAPNALGLYDMAGNVWEWCLDSYEEEYYRTPPPVNNPRGPEENNYRTLRGGSWRFDPWNNRAVTRMGAFPESILSESGFRVVLTVAERTKTTNTKQESTSNKKP